jgi:hypothetical protein
MAAGSSGFRNVPVYGDSRQGAVRRVQSAAGEIILDRIAHDELRIHPS